MTIWEALTRRRAGRLAVAIEMIVVCIGGPAVMSYMLARAGLDPPLPLMAGMTVLLFIGFYVRALRLNT